MALPGCDAMMNTIDNVCAHEECIGMHPRFRSIAVEEFKSLPHINTVSRMRLNHAQYTPTNSPPRPTFAHHSDEQNWIAQRMPTIYP